MCWTNAHSIFEIYATPYFNGENGIAIQVNDQDPGNVIIADLIPFKDGIPGLWKTILAKEPHTFTPDEHAQFLLYVSLMQHCISAILDKAVNQYQELHP
jgi:hypothetical protein